MRVSTFVATFASFALSRANELRIETNTGTVTGLINGTAPDVRQFLSIPFAQPPTGQLRWLPPQKLETNSSNNIDATAFPPSCPQYLSRVPTVYNQVIVPWIPDTKGQDPTAGASLEASSEDCLYLAIWAPTGNKTKLPVLFFQTGGAFVTNGIDVPAQLPYHWVQRTQSHIVVTINYRMNIFGFPNAAGLNTSQNIGILDQRAALEWVQDNIAAFGGDPNRITMWGQSAGAISTDFHNFAYPDNPIAKSFFAQSGTVFLDINSQDFSQTNFSFMAANLGCGNLQAIEELDCMRNVSYADIENFLGHYQDNSTLIDPSQPLLAFTPIPDNITVFSNYTNRYAQGLYANIPTIYSSTLMEGEALISYPTLPPINGTPQTPPNQTQAQALTLNGFHCPAVLSTILRQRFNASTPTFRYLFSGNFSNVSPLPWMGAYHASDLAFMFGTHQDLVSPSGQGSTDFEFGVSDSMEDYVLALVSDPSGQTAEKMGWQLAQDGKVLEFGADGKVVQGISSSNFDAVCSDYLASYGVSL